jgi:hypothetical protein
MSWQNKFKKIVKDKKDLINYTKSIVVDEDEFDYFIEFEWVDSIDQVHFHTLEYSDVIDLLNDLHNLKNLYNITVHAYGLKKINDLLSFNTFKR